MNKDLKDCENLDELLETLTCENAYEYEPDRKLFDNDDDHTDACIEWSNRGGDEPIYKYSNDLCDLPNFGGKEPEDTSEIWSWDEKRLLVGSCADEFNIVDRDDWFNDK